MKVYGYINTHGTPKPSDAIKLYSIKNHIIKSLIAGKARSMIVSAVFSKYPDVALFRDLKTAYTEFRKNGWKNSDFSMFEYDTSNSNFRYLEYVDCINLLYKS